MIPKDLIHKLSLKSGYKPEVISDILQAYKTITQESLENLDYALIPGVGKLVPIVQESKIMCSNLNGKRTPIRIDEKLKVKYIPDESFLREVEKKVLSSPTGIDYEQLIQNSLK